MRRPRALLVAVAVTVSCLVGAAVPSDAIQNGVDQPGISWLGLVRVTAVNYLAQATGYCTATVVGDGWVLTAAHCLKDSLHRVITDNRRLTVEMGAARLGDPKGAWYTVDNKLVQTGPGAQLGPDVALLHLRGFDAARWHAIPLIFANTPIAPNMSVAAFGYGGSQIDARGNQTGAQTLHKSPDGSLSYDANCARSTACVYSARARILEGDSGGPFLVSRSGAFQLFGVVSRANAKFQDETIAYGSSMDERISDGRSVRQWIQQTARLPQPPRGTIVRDPASKNSWLFSADGYRHWIPTGGDYLCLVAHGTRVLNYSQINIDTLPDAVGSAARCASSAPSAASPSQPSPSGQPLTGEPTPAEATPGGGESQPPPAAPMTIPETEATRGANTFTNYSNASGLGPRIQPGQQVEISCKVLDASIASASPDGYWYRIASPPWNDEFYAVANTFWNGDIAGQKPYTHNTDFAVPDC